MQFWLENFKIQDEARSGIIGIDSKPCRPLDTELSQLTLYYSEQVARKATRGQYDKSLAVDRDEWNPDVQEDRIDMNMDVDGIFGQGNGGESLP